ncbi:MAG: Coenzyme F420 hydrogenase/dehydrogenase, beta subunit C-terminal domain [Candidatus Lokiarchaeota archaeon]|nr:Coenzyme F420 hydrogenase/dehydrogenase, beta subunit C-terminal domain [Candidatus Lokiarchaeota archaeon]
MAEEPTAKRSEVKPKSFEDLIKDVHEKDICGECGGCVSFCSAAEIGAIEMTEDGPPHYANKDNCLHCGICYLICPETFELDKELNKKYDFRAPIGNWLKIVTAQAKDPRIREVATDGGVVTAILIALLEDNLINGALISKRINSFQRVPFFATSKEEILEAAGTYYDLKGPVPELGNYNTFVSTISELKKIKYSDSMKVAVVGVPCQIHSIRKMQELNIIPAHIVKYTLGLFCYENFKFDNIARARIEERFKFSFNDIEKINIKEDLIIKLKTNDNPLKIEFSDLKDIMRHACRVCENFSNYFSDISFGGLGSQTGYTTVMVRTKTGEKIYNLAQNKGYIIEPNDLNGSVEKSKMLAQIISFSERKSKRAESFEVQ